MLLVMVVQDDLELEQLDVETTFLHGKPYGTIFVARREYFVIAGKEDCVHLLKRSLYGLKQFFR